jgi:hypothetical protein
VKYWALKIMKRFKLEGFLILKSSKNSYHVVFNAPVSWAKNMSIVAWICLQCRSWNLIKWFLLQCIKGEPTLRVSSKGEKSSPRIVYKYGKQDNQIQSFCECRKLIKSIIKRIS